MRHPPAISWPVTDDRRWRAVQLLLWAAAGGSVGVWAGQGLDDAAAGGALAGIAAALGGGWLGWRTGAQPDGEIHWTGSQWRWRAPGGRDEAVGVPGVMLDLQGWMLLRLRPLDPRARPVWCSVRRGAGDGAARWAGFRAAVYSAASRSDRRSGPERPLP